MISSLMLLIMSFADILIPYSLFDNVFFHRRLLQSKKDYCYIYIISFIEYVKLAFFSHTIKRINHVHCPKQRKVTTVSH